MTPNAMSTNHCGLRAWRGCSPGTDMDCPTGKVAHTLKTAKAASKRARHRTELPLTPYRCAICGQWHVGQRNEAKRPIKTIYDNHHLRGT